MTEMTPEEELREIQGQILQAYQAWWAEWNKGMDYLEEWGDRLIAEMEEEKP